jgi:hypothetical protein
MSEYFLEMRLSVLEIGGRVHGISVFGKIMTPRAS